MTTTETWLDIMPAIPLARGVAFLLYFDGCEEYCGSDRRRVCLSFEDDYAEWVDDDGDFCSTPECDTRVDLDDPQGFGYALRYCLRTPLGVLKLAHALGFGTGVGEQYSGSDMKGWIVGWAATDLATDQDRLALARALAEVTR